MDNRAEVREFLTSRRARITPKQAGLPSGSRRRVPGLRKSEVAALADMSVQYYAKLERGSLAGVSPAVLEAVARALKLDDAERAHLLHLAQAADGSDALTRPRRRSARQWQPHRSLQWTLDAITAGPAFVRNGRMDVLAANQLARAFYHDVYATPSNQTNLARFTFFDPASHRFYADWDQAADVVVAILRTEAGRNSHDKDLHDLVGELSTRSDAFRTRSGAHDVRHHGTGTKRFHHQAVGELTLAYEGLEVAAEPGLTLNHLHRRTRLTLGTRSAPSRLLGRRPEGGSIPRAAHDRLKPAPCPRRKALDGAATATRRAGDHRPSRSTRWQDGRMERVLGIGGHFMRAVDPAALTAWYRDCLGLDVDGNGRWHQEAGPTVFAAFESGTDYFNSPTQQTMLNFRVRDLDAMLAQLRSMGADVAEETQDMEGIGRFGWVTDPEGNRIELWQPA